MTISKQQQPRDHFAMVPRIVRTQYKNLSLVEKWLYTCLRDLCGDKGICFRTIRELESETDVSCGSLSKMIPHLHEVGLIHAEKKRRSKHGREIWHITIVDIWQENAKVCSSIEQKKTDNGTKDAQVCSIDERNVQSVNNAKNDLSSDCSNFADRRRYINKKKEEEKEDTAQNAHAFVLPSVSFSSSENTPTQEKDVPPTTTLAPTTERGRGRPKKELTPVQSEVFDEWDRIGGIPEDRNERGNKECVVYLASLIEDGHAKLLDLERVYKKLNEGYWKGQVDFKKLKDKFRVTLVDLNTTLPKPEDTIPDWMREAMV